MTGDAADLVPWSTGDAGMAKLASVLKEIADLRSTYPEEIVDRAVGSLFGEARPGQALGQMLGLSGEDAVVLGRALIREQVASVQPRDTLERMLIEQLVMCHERINVLSKTSVRTGPIERAMTVHDQCNRAMATYRKGMLALKQYREARRQHVSVQQLNQAGQQNIVMAPVRDSKKMTNELGANHADEASSSGESA